MNDWTQRHAAAIGFVGLVLLVLGGAAYLVVGQFDLPLRIVLGVGAALVVFALLENPRGVFNAFGGRRLLYGSNTVLTVVLVLAILGAVNVIAARQSKRWDLTASKRFTLSQQTVEVLQRIKEPVQVKAFFRRSNPGRDDAAVLIDEYRAHNPLLQVEFIDPDVNPGAAEQYNIRYDGSVVFVRGDKRQEATTVTEAGLTSALLKLESSTVRKVYFITGHDERSTSDFDRQGLATAKQALESDNIQTADLTLASAGKVPEDASAIVLASPRKPLLPEERTAIQTYLKNGGHALILRDPRGGIDLNDLLRDWGVQLDDGVVVDPVASFMNDRVTLVANRYRVSPITEQMRAITIFPVAGFVKVLTDTKGLTITPLVESSDQSWVEYGNEMNFDEGKDVKGPVPIAVTVEQAETDTASQSSQNQTTKPKTRLVVIADTDFATNNLLDQDRVPGNRDFFVNSVNWLTGSEDQITIRPTTPDVRPVILTPTQLNLVLFGSVIFLPGVVLAAGAYVWWRRR